MAQAPPSMGTTSPTILTPADSPEWRDVLRRLKHRRVVSCDWNGVAAFAKRATRGRGVRRALRALLAPLLRRLLCPRMPFVPATSRAAPFELHRLIELHGAGVRVPRVLAATESVFVIEDAGTALEALLAQAPDAEARCRWVLAAADDLAGFHAAGHWHGGAQIRNVAVSPDGFARFDFDRDLDRHYPLPLLQALDVFLFFHSLPGLHEEDHAAIRAAAQRYARQAPAEVRQVLARVCPVVLRVARWTWLAAVTKEATRLRTSSAALGIVADAASASSGC